MEIVTHFLMLIGQGLYPALLGGPVNTYGCLIFIFMHANYRFRENNMLMRVCVYQDENVGLLNDLFTNAFDCANPKHAR